MFKTLVSVGIAVLLLVGGIAGEPTPCEGVNGLASPAVDDVNIVRDRWGVAHVYAETDEGVFFGAGYATAQDRLFQMELSRRYVQGRLAEILGERWLGSDRLMRTLGLYVHAQAVVPHLDPDTRHSLDAYAAGVNEYARQHAGKLLYLFDRFGIQPDPWTPADCIAMWMRVSERFDRGWRSEVNAKRAWDGRLAELGERAARQQTARLIDESACVVSEEDFQRTDPEVYRRLKAKSRERKPGDDPRDEGISIYRSLNLFSLSPRLRGEREMCRYQWDEGQGAVDLSAVLEFEGLKASHAWVVSGNKSTTGKPLLESDPQIAVTAPSLWYEIHLCDGRYNVRGIGVAGAPGLLIGYNDAIAWGATALGSDNADLFEEHVNPEKPNEYRWRDGWEPIRTRTEIVAVKGGDSVTVQVRSTRHGPIVNEWVAGVESARPQNRGVEDSAPATRPLYALHYLVTNELTSSLEGLLGMMRARDWRSFCQGLSRYRSPGLHVIYADTENNIGYHTAGALPMRKRFGGQMPVEGWTGQDEWQGLIPFEELPHVLNPKAGFIVSANHVPVGAWYPHELTVGTGGTGDNARSWRLRELLSEPRKFGIDDFLTVHRDCTNPLLRDFLTLALKVAEEAPLQESTPAVQATGRLLKNWDGRVVTNSPAHDFLQSVNPLLQRSLRDTPLISRYGGGPAGVCWLLKEHGARFRETSKTPQDPDVRRWLLDYLQRASEGRTGRGAAERPAAKAPEQPRKRASDQETVLLYQTNLENFGSLDPEKDFPAPPLTCVMVDTIWSQRGNSYSHIADLSDPDNSRSLLPPGVSEDPAGPHFKDQVDLWAKGTMHPAPLRRERVLTIKESEMLLKLPKAFRRSF